MQQEFIRTINLIGQDAFEKLKAKKIIVFGVGGVGGYVVEALARCGIENIDVVDNDKVSISNINRQIIALHSTIGENKVDVIEKRILDINPKINIKKYNLFYDENTKEEIDLSGYDYIIDAIDSTKSKLLLIELANKLNKKIISSMGTGNKLDPTKFEISDIYKTSVCPLARVMRNELKKINIKKLDFLYSKENPVKNNDNTVSSISFCPSVAGLIIASFVVKNLT